MGRKYDLTESSVAGLRNVVYTTEFLNKLHAEAPDLHVMVTEALAPGRIASEDNLPNELDDLSIVTNGAYLSGTSRISGRVAVTGAMGVIDSVIRGNACLTGDPNAKRFIGVSTVKFSDITVPEGRRLDIKDTDLSEVTGSFSGRLAASRVYKTTLDSYIRVLESSVTSSNIRMAAIDKCLVRDATILGADLLGAEVHESEVSCPPQLLREPVYGEHAAALFLRIHGDGIRITDHAEVHRIDDVFVMNNNWSSGRVICYTKSNDRWHTGCFSGSTAELLSRAKSADVEDGGSRFEYLNVVVELVNRFKGMIPTHVTPSVLLSDGRLSQTVELELTSQTLLNRMLRPTVDTPVNP